MNIFDLANKYLNSINIESIKLKSINEEDKCLARVWDKGDYGNKGCQRLKFKGCLCKKHYNASLRMNGTWWLGLINEERPENPIHPISGKHKWSKDKNGNDYIIENEDKKQDKEIDEKVPVKSKRKRGRPKGSKNKKK